jgi:hypothetical protein
MQEGAAAAVPGVLPPLHRCLPQQQCQMWQGAPPPGVAAVARGAAVQTATKTAAEQQQGGAEAEGGGRTRMKQTASAAIVAENRGVGRGRADGKVGTRMPTTSINDQQRQLGVSVAANAAQAWGLLMQPSQPQSSARSVV